MHVTIGGREFDIDIVTAISPEGIEKPLLVPDRDLSKWIHSDPLGYSKALSEINKKYSERIVPLIKMFKHWRDVQMKYKRPKSYWLECLIYKHALAENLNINDSSFGELFLSLLTSVYDDFVDLWKDSDAVPVIQDPILKNNVSAGWSRDEFEAFMRRIEEGRAMAERALSIDDEADAIKLWQRLFNDDSREEYFPSVVDETLEAVIAGKGLFITSAGRVLSQSAPGQRSWPSPVHQNYGDESEAPKQ